MKRSTLKVLALFCLLRIPVLSAEDKIIEFNDSNWDLENATVTSYLDRKALTGIAILKNVELEDGIIEVDIAVDGNRAYPGVMFRMQSEKNYERFYIRPHRQKLYADALQYTPVINGIAGWQLYSGEGYTNYAVIPANQWNHLKIEISGKQAKFYWNDMEKPALEVHDLKHRISKGSIGLERGVGNANVYFSNFQYRQDTNLNFDPPPVVETPEGTILEWEISRSYPAAEIDIEQMPYPRFFYIYLANWQKVTAEPTGLVDIARYINLEKPEPSLIFARKIFNSDKKQEIRMNFGYSDEVTIYMNGKRIYYGMSAYRYRDSSFLGIVGLADAVYLPVEKGRNEIFMIIKENFGGWGFKAKTEIPLDEPVKNHGRLWKVWETSDEFLTPESVIYDKKRNVLYVTSFNMQYKKDAEESEYLGYISKLGLDGKIIEKKWISSLHAPAGMAIYKDKLYTVERRNLTEIDLKTGKMANRYPIPNCDFPNDLAIDKKGNIYITDTATSNWPESKIYKFSKGKFEVWLKGYDAWRANGIYLYNDKLIFGGNPDDPFLKSIDIKTNKLDKITSLGAGVIDGIRVLKNGNYLVSHWEGPVYLITPTGEVTEIMNSIGRFNVADFEYIPEKNLMIIPTFMANKVIAYTLTD